MSGAVMMVGIGIIAALLGLVAGTGIHVAAVRLPAGLTPLGAPVCAGCAAPVPPQALLPWSRTTCTACGAESDRQRLATQLAAAVLVVLALFLHGLTVSGISVAVFSLILLLILRIDWQHHLIYVATIVPGIVVAFAVAALTSPEKLISALVAAALEGFAFALFFVLAMVIYRRQALGFGDILLAVLIGAMTGLGQVVSAMFIGMVLAALGGVLLVLIGVRTWHDYIPYGAYLCAGAILVLLIP